MSSPFGAPSSEGTSSGELEGASGLSVTPSDVLFGDMRLVAKAAGATALVGIGIGLAHALQSPASGWSGAVMWTIALLASGGAVGFLFGIPKVVQGNRHSGSEGPPASGATGAGSPGAASSPSTGRSKQDYQQRVNTNLEDISDWLTKIIVGLGLVQLTTLPGRLHNLSSAIALTLGGDSPPQHSAAMAMILYCVPSGFVFGYLMTRLYIQGALARAEQNVTATVVDVLDQLRDIDRRSRSALSAAVRGVVKKPTLDTDDEEVSEAVWNSDPHKGFAGGHWESNQRRISATIVPAVGVDAAACEVRIQVSSTDQAKPLRGFVTFHLHPTFKPSTEKVQVSQSGVAELNVVSEGTFTVGAEADEGQTKLELDLMRVKGGTEKFYDQ